METKLCNRCKKTKPIKEFYSRPDVNGGHYAYCKHCVRKRQREYTKRNARRKAGLEPLPGQTKKQLAPLVNYTHERVKIAQETFLYGRTRN